MYVCNNKLYSYNTKTNLDMYYDAYYYFYVLDTKHAKSRRKGQ